MAIEIPLSKTGKYAGKYIAIIDDCDSDLAELNWTVCFREHTIYAKRATTKDGVQKTILLHCVILERTLPRKLEKGDEADHVDNNGLNNQRNNIRLANPSKNQWNKSMAKNNTSGYKGVHWDKRDKRFIAQIGYLGKMYHIGSFGTALEAWEARCEKAEELHQEFANHGNGKLAKAEQL